jgi:hypothetical protein
MRELNPNHPVTREMHEQWHKFCALLMLKLGADEIEITIEDIDRMELRTGGTNITIRTDGDVIVLTLVTDAEAERLAREEGGLLI